MKVDWKHLATTPGYKSLKAAYIRDVQKAEKDRDRFKRRPMRDKKEFLKKFNWVISRAIHYAHHKNLPVWEILNIWEAKRDYGWLNYYQDSRQPKLNFTKSKPLGIKGLRAYYKKEWSSLYKPSRKIKMRDAIIHMQKAKSTKSPLRWPTSRKKREANIRNYRSKKSL